MLRSILRISLVWTAVAGVSGSARAESAGDRYPAAASSTRAPSPERRSVPMPMAFEANEGQTDPRVRFIARGAGYALFLTSTEAVLAHGTDAIHMAFRGASKGARIVPVDRRPGGTNYLIGTDPARWRRSVATYGKVRYEQIYPGIDLVYYGNDRQVEYDLVVQPGGDARKIRLDVTGARALETAVNGDLVARTQDGEMRLRKPTIYQASAGGQAPRAIQGRYRLMGDHTVAFDVGEYDRTQALVIDPIIVYSTYLGGSGAEHLRDGRQMIAVGPDGSAYVTGTTGSPDFPTTVGSFQASGPGNDVFVAKLSPNGSDVVYATYLGGTNGTADQGAGIAVDASGSAYVTGLTNSDDFPITSGTSGGNLFVTKFDPTGSHLVYSRRLATTDTSIGIAVGADGSAYVTGKTFDNYPGFPVTPGAFQRFCGYGPEVVAPPTNPGCSFANGRPNTDAFVLKLDPAGTSIVYATFLGGISPDVGTGIAVDAAGQAYVTGLTTSRNFPTTPGAFQAVTASAVDVEPIDVFVTKLSADGSTAIFSTYLSTSAPDTPGAIAAGADGSAYVTGYSQSENFPTTAGAYQPTLETLRPWSFAPTPAFVTKFTPGGALAYSTLLAGLGFNQGVGIAVDDGGRAYVVGATDAHNFPTTFDATQPSLGVPYPGGGSTDAFVSVLSASGGALVFSTYLGGPAFDFAQGVALGPDGSACIVGVTNHDVDANFPTTEAASQPLYGGAGDLFVSRISVGPPPDTTPPAISVPSNIVTNATTPAGAVVTYTATASDLVDGPLTILCTPASGATFAVGTTSVSCSATDSSANAGTSVFSVTVRGAGEITSSLIADVAVASFQQGHALLQNVLKSLAGGNTGAACNQLDAFLNKVEAQTGKALTAAEALALTLSAQDARAALGCP